MNKDFYYLNDSYSYLYYYLHKMRKDSYEMTKTFKPNLQISKFGTSKTYKININFYTNVFYLKFHRDLLYIKTFDVLYHNRINVSSNRIYLDSSNPILEEFLVKRDEMKGKELIEYKERISAIALITENL